MSGSRNESKELEPSWQRTYEKQRLAKLKRDKRVKQETADGAEALQANEDANKGSSSTLFPCHPVSLQVGSILSAHYTSIAPVVLPPTSPSPKSEGPGLELPRVTIAATPRGDKRHSRHSSFGSYPTGDDDVQSVLCDSMCSLSVSSTPSAPVPSSPPHTPGRHKKYYVVSAGKCAGVFDSWPYVQSLMSGVTGSCQKSYATYAEAYNVYQEIKGKGLVRIIRDPEDVLFFGPDEQAMQ